MELWRGHAALIVGSLHERAEEPVGVEERLLPEPEIVDADDAGEPQLQIARVRVHLADRVPDDPVGVVIEVRARRGQRGDDPVLDERDEAALVEAGWRHGAGQREEDAAVLRDRSPHELVGGAHLAADISAEGVLEEVAGGFAPGDRPGIDAPRFLERLAELRFARGGHGGGTVEHNSPTRMTHLLRLRPHVHARLRATSGAGDRPRRHWEPERIPRPAGSRRASRARARPCTAAARSQERRDLAGTQRPRHVRLPDQPAGRGARSGTCLARRAGARSAPLRDRQRGKGTDREGARQSPQRLPSALRRRERGVDRGLRRCPPGIPPGSIRPSARRDGAELRSRRGRSGGGGEARMRAALLGSGSFRRNAPPPDAAAWGGSARRRVRACRRSGIRNAIFAPAGRPREQSGGAPLDRGTSVHGQPFRSLGAGDRALADLRSAYFLAGGKNPRANVRASAGNSRADLRSERARPSGVAPSAWMETRSPVLMSSAAPRAMVRLPSERISTTRRATTGGSRFASRGPVSLRRRSSVTWKV